jgi:hypothetical protein
MIKIFCDFSKFSAKIGVFLKNQCYDRFFSKFSIVWLKNDNFLAKFFGENILKIVTSVPGRRIFEVLRKRREYQRAESKHASA